MWLSRIDKLWKDTRGEAEAIAFIIMMPLLLLLLYITVDFFVINNIEQEIQFRLDTATLAAANYATDDKCVISEEALDFGKEVFNVNDSSYKVNITLTDITSLEQREQGVVRFQALADTDVLFRNSLLANEYTHTFYIESTAICNRYRDH